jgi:flagellar biosynthetic protein FlhB
MSEETQQQERTEPASPHRRKEFRDRGEVAKSREVVPALTFLVAAGLLSFGAPAATRLLADMLRDGLTLVGEAPALGGGGLAALPRQLAEVAPVLIVVMGVLAMVAVGGNILQTGLLWTAKPLTPKLSKLSPLPKLKKMFFSKDTVVELLKTLVKVGALGFIAWTLLASFLPQLAALPLADLTYTGDALGRSLQLLLAAVGAGAVVIAAADYAWQHRQLEKRMRMTKEEVRRERLQHEGNPLFKGLRQRKHREISMNRMLRDVAKADVVVTNPTHYAVALRYRAEEGTAPRLVAKGKDAVALRIRAEARRHGVPVMEQKALARALHAGVKVGQEVPEKLYQAVAEVLAFVYRVNQRLAPGGRPTAARTAGSEA